MLILLPSKQTIDRPQITLSIDLGDQEPEFRQYELSLNTTIGEIKVLVSNDYGVPKVSQHIYFNDRKLVIETQKIGDAGVTDHDLLRVTQISEPRRATSRQDDEASVHQQIENIRTQLLQRTRDPAQRQAFSQQAPELEAVLNDAGRFREVFLSQRNAIGQRDAQADDDWAMMNDDMSPEGQAKLMERIRQERIGAEADKAMEEHPEREFYQQNVSHTIMYMLIYFKYSEELRCSTLSSRSMATR